RVAKYAAARVGLPLVSVATNLAHDGLCSPVATLDNDNGRGSYGVPHAHRHGDRPVGDPRGPPDRFVRSGIGDAISNISAIADWELSHQVNGEQIDGLAAAMARTAGEAYCATPPAPSPTTSSSPSSPSPWCSPASPSRSAATPGPRPRLPRDQPRLRPALPPSGPPATASRSAWAPPSPCTCAG
ncbi:iron-containing alcohol dehydrogenase, partial [Streptomyces sp. SID7803]|nr:iron-containing alcohol dehydrogenase [Streptomyces sp. SID7803]